jgi:hypothetical protein
MLYKPNQLFLDPISLGPMGSSVVFSSSVQLLAVGALTIFIVVFARIFVRRSGGPPFPPGPQPDPLIGNIRQMGSNDLKVLFEQWGKEYGRFTTKKVLLYHSCSS